MPDRGRDLKIGVLSDASRFDLSDPADQLEDVGRRAEDMGHKVDESTDELKRLAAQGKDAQRELDRLSQANRDNDFDRLGTDAHQAGRKVERAFDGIDDAARRSRRKVDDSTDGMKTSLRDVGDEAGSTAREAAASFSGSGDIGDALQELAANAPSVLGPLGLAFGTVAGIGVGLFRAQAEKIKEQVKTLVDQMIEDGGRLSRETINNRLQELAGEGELARLKEMAEALDLAGVSYSLLANAKAGDEEALRSLNTALDENAERYAALNDEAGNVSGVNELMRSRIRQVRNEFAEQNQTVDLTREAISNYRDATVSTRKTVVQQVDGISGAFDDLRSSTAKPIAQRVRLDRPSDSAIAEWRRNLAQQIGTLVVPVQPGQTRTSNTSDNSRYRY